jgi:hypothetical protein
MRAMLRPQAAWHHASLAQAPTETTMFTKSLFAFLVLASASFTLTSNVNAGPYPSQAELRWMERASQITDGGN